MEEAIAALKEQGIDVFELMGVLTIPVDSPDDIVPMITMCTTLFKEIGFNKSWRIDPYYYDCHSSLTAEMFGEVKNV